jgi:hypothetical protein
VKRPWIRGSLAVFSLGLFLLGNVFWALSYFDPKHTPDMESGGAAWHDGAFFVKVARERWVKSPNGMNKPWTFWSFAGFGYFHGRPPHGSMGIPGAPFQPFFFPEEWIWMIPFWFFVAVSGVFPTIVVSRVLREARERRHSLNQLCRACGYDLRATPERCPECGAVQAVGALKDAME